MLSLVEFSIYILNWPNATAAFRKFIPEFVTANFLYCSNWEPFGSYSCPIKVSNNWRGPNCSAGATIVWRLLLKNQIFHYIHQGPCDCHGGFNDLSIDQLLWLMFSNLEHFRRQIAFSKYELYTYSVKIDCVPLLSSCRNLICRILWVLSVPIAT